MAPVVCGEGGPGVHDVNSFTHFQLNAVTDQIQNSPLNHTRYSIKDDKEKRSFSLTIVFCRWCDVSGRA